MVPGNHSGISILLITILILAVGQAVWSDEQLTGMDKYMDRYTGADADRTGSESCLICHDDKFPVKVQNHINLIDKDRKNPEFGFGCESCHGPGGMHNGDVDGILTPWKMTPEQNTDLCSKCHMKLGSYDKNRWLDSEHFYTGLDCFACHSGHSVNKSFLNEKTESETCTACHLRQRTEFNRRSHHPVYEGLLECSSCHNAMSGKFDYQLNDDGDSLCFECHADKRGPFLFTMDIGTDSGGDGCLSCHYAHGSNTDSLLMYPQRLCTRCHSEMSPIAHFPGTCWSSDCHANIHGSNTHPLFFD